MNTIANQSSIRYLCTITALLGLSLHQGVAQDVGPQLVGSWESVELKTDLYSLKSAKKLFVRISGLQRRVGDTGSVDYPTDVDGEVVLLKPDGVEELLPDSMPMTLVTSNIIRAGPSDNPYWFVYTISNGFLHLHEDTTWSHLDAKLTRTQNPPITLKHEPAWIPAWRKLDRALTGEWKTLEFSATNFAEFAGVTNISLVVYGVGSLDMGKSEPYRETNVKAELLVMRSDGRWSIEPNSVKVRLKGSDLIFGMGPEAFSFHLSLSDNVLTLTRDFGDLKFAAKLKRANVNPGEPRFVH